MKSPIVPFVAALVLLSASFLLADQGSRKPSRNNRAVTYPPMARQLHLTGTVRLDVLVAATGKVKKVEVLGGNPLLAAAAVETVKGWSYEPAPSDTSETVIVKSEP